MAYSKIIHALIIFLVAKYLRSERRIRGGYELKTDKPYLVYLVQSENTNTSYSGWTCGGAIVSPHFILTAAACVEDVNYLYVIAGYKKHVPSEEIDKDACTKKNEKENCLHVCTEIILKYQYVSNSTTDGTILENVLKNGNSKDAGSYPAYEFDYAHVEKWSAIDIGVAKVDTPFGFHDQTYEKICSYKPNQIIVNYDSKYQAENIDAIVMGWGHLEKWRKPEDTTIYLQKEPRYAAIQILNKNICKQLYEGFPVLQKTIEHFMICTKESGNINADGHLISTSKPIAQGCSMLRSGKPSPECLKDQNEIYDMTRRRSSDTNATYNISAIRQGICQNDHGGPLVTWVGGHEVLIGVASVFRVNAESQCEGPYLFTSTQCNGLFIYCLISHYENRRNSICDKPPRERGFQMIHRRISWANQPNGPAHNELVKIRPQVPISNFG